MATRQIAARSTASPSRDSGPLVWGSHRKYPISIFGRRRTCLRRRPAGSESDGTYPRRDDRVAEELRHCSSRRLRGREASKSHAALGSAFSFWVYVRSQSYFSAASLAARRTSQHWERMGFGKFGMDEKAAKALRLLDDWARIARKLRSRRCERPRPPSLPLAVASIAALNRPALLTRLAIQARLGRSGLSKEHGHQDLDRTSQTSIAWVAQSVASILFRDRLSGPRLQPPVLVQPMAVSSERATIPCRRRGSRSSRSPSASSA